MRVDRYLVFPDIASALAFSAALDEAYGGAWDVPNVHPLDGRALIRWNDAHLAQYADMLLGVTQISPEEAEPEGWLFGRHRGPFAHAKAKLEEAQLLQSALRDLDKIPNFPVYRAMFFGFLGATYALKESLCKTCRALGVDATEWYEIQFGILKSDPVLGAFYKLNNRNKHESGPLPLRSYLSSLASTSVGAPPSGARLRISHEGVFVILEEGTPRERVVAVAGHIPADWRVMLEMSEDGVVGQATELSEHVIGFYQQFVFDARRKFGGEFDLHD